MNIEGHASSVTDTECVLERTLRDRDWPEPELLTLHKHGSEPGAGHEVTTDVMQSPSGEHQEQVTVTVTATRAICARLSPDGLTP